jgi:FlaA1/EpsC-like NDP-sugar epimerase
MKRRLLGLPRFTKTAIMVVVDVVLLPLALWLAFSLRLGEPVAFTGEWGMLFLVAPLTALPVFFAFGMYRAMLRYMGQQALWTLLKAVSLAVLLWGVVVLLLRMPTVPRSVLFIYWFTSVGMLSGVRLLARYLLGRNLAAVGERRAVAIYGAGVAGIQLAGLLRYDPEIAPVCFIDDDVHLLGKEAAGLRIYSPQELKRLIERLDVAEVLLAMPAISRKRQQEILNWLEPFPVHVRVVPAVSELTQGQLRREDLREVELEDLLGREPVLPEEHLLTDCIAGKSVMVTGAGGSIGSELCRQIIRLQPRRLVLYELSEFALYSIDHELRNVIASLGLPIELVTLLGSVQNRERLERTMRSFSVDTVYHAAAYKHVPLVEHNMVEGVRNNIFGTLHAAQAAQQCGVATFVLISTDKAVRPTNVMGATKRFAELLLQGLDLQQRNSAEKATTFCMVRFGNVLGSSGSVVPLFREQIRRGGPVTVTHREIIRYFMTIPEASQLVIQAGAMGEGGDVFVLDMGEPVRIADLAQKMVHLMGYEIRDEVNPDGDIAIEYTGLRPGEKLYEELLIGDNPVATRHPRILRAEEVTFEWSWLPSRLETLTKACDENECQRIRAVLLEAVNGYQPNDQIEDVVWQQEHQRSIPVRDKASQ